MIILLHHGQVTKVHPKIFTECRYKGSQSKLASRLQAIFVKVKSQRESSADGSPSPSQPQIYSALHNALVDFAVGPAVPGSEGTRSRDLASIIGHRQVEASQADVVAAALMKRFLSPKALSRYIFPTIASPINWRTNIEKLIIGVENYIDVLFSVEGEPIFNRVSLSAEERLALIGIVTASVAREYLVRANKRRIGSSFHALFWMLSEDRSHRSKGEQWFRSHMLRWRQFELFCLEIPALRKLDLMYKLARFRSTLSGSGVFSSEFYMFQETKIALLNSGIAMSAVTPALFSAYIKKACSIAEDRDCDVTEVEFYPLQAASETYDQYLLRAIIGPESSWGRGI